MDSDDKTATDELTEYVLELLEQAKEEAAAS